MTDDEEGEGSLHLIIYFIVCVRKKALHVEGGEAKKKSEEKDRKMKKERERRERKELNSLHV